MTRFANTDETGTPIAVPKTCLYCIPRKVKLVEFKQISSSLIRSVDDKLGSVLDQIVDVAWLCLMSTELELL